MSDPIARSCGACLRPFDETDTRPDGAARHSGWWCRGCMAACQAHHPGAQCAVCATYDEPVPVRNAYDPHRTPTASTPVPAEVAELLAAVVETLTVPVAAGQAGRAAEAALMRDRAAAVRGALGSAQWGADVEGMTRALRSAVVSHPVTYAPFEREGGGQ